MMMFEGISDLRQQVRFGFCSEGRTKQDVWNKEDRARNIILVASQPNIFVHALDLRIADVSTIDMAEKVQNAEHTDESEVDLRRQVSIIVKIRDNGIPRTFLTTFFPSLPW